MEQGTGESSMETLYPKALDRAKGAIFPKDGLYYKDHFMNVLENGLIQ